MSLARSRQRSRSWLPMNTKLKLDAYDIRKYRPADIADELTLINRTLLLRIKPEELFNFAFLSIEKDIFAPNVTLMLKFYERTSAVFATQIVRQTSVQTRVSVVTHLFLVMRQLYVKNHDIHSIRIILAAFDHSSVFRLRETWRTFRIMKPQFYTALKYLWNMLSQENNWTDYRLWLEQKFIKDCSAKKQPMLLFIGYLLSKMVIDRYRYFQTQQDTMVIMKEKDQSEDEPSSGARVNTRLVELVKSSPRRLLLMADN